MEVSLRLPDGSEYEQIGRLDFIDNVVDRKTGTVIIRAVFANPEQLLVPGLYVRTVLSREETTDRLVIPQAAIQEDQAGKFVMVVGPGNKVEQRRITTGPAHAGALEVRDGLQPDEKVIVEGVQKVRPGIEVDPKLAPNPNEGNPEQEGSDGGQAQSSKAAGDEDGDQGQGSETDPAKSPAGSDAGEG
jgi:membrane fusion protein (multidrug efflux system)